MSGGVDEAGKTQHHWISAKENKSTDPSGTANARYCHVGFQVSTMLSYCLGHVAVSVRERAALCHLFRAFSFA